MDQDFGCGLYLEPAEIRRSGSVRMITKHACTLAERICPGQLQQTVVFSAHRDVVVANNASTN
jgi:hypothetical protein